MVGSSVTFAAAPITTNSRSLADAAQKDNSKTVAELDQETEAAAAGLVKSHLPELEQVLNRLRKAQPRQYERAVRDLARSAKKLDAVRKRDEQLYELEVELLKAQTDVNFLTAKLKVRDSQSDRNLLRKAVARLHQASIARGEYDVHVLQQRLERARQQLVTASERLEAKRADSNEHLEKSYLSLLRKAGRQAEAEKVGDKQLSAKNRKK